MEKSNLKKIKTITKDKIKNLQTSNLFFNLLTSSSKKNRMSFLLIILKNTEIKSKQFINVHLKLIPDTKIDETVLKTYINRLLK